jgi:hypothetical protein
MLLLGSLLSLEILAGGLARLAEVQKEWQTCRSEACGGLLILDRRLAEILAEEGSI